MHEYLDIRNWLMSFRGPSFNPILLINKNLLFENSEQISSSHTGAVTVKHAHNRHLSKLVLTRYKLFHKSSSFPRYKYVSVLIEIR